MAEEKLHMFLFGIILQKVVIEVCVKSEIVYFTVACLVAKSLNRSEAKGDLVMIQTSLFSNANYFVIMLIGYWSLSQQGHLQRHSKSKAWQLITQL